MSDTTSRGFFLRRDFAFELGAIGNEIDPNAAAKPRLIPRPRNLVNCGVLAPGRRYWVPLASDGRTYVPMPAEGLFTEMLEKARAALELQPQESLPVVTPILAKPAEAFAWPVAAIVHNLATSRAEFLPVHTALYRARLGNGLLRDEETP